MDIVVWLRSLGLEEYEEAFRDNKIDERILPNLTQEDLKEIGIGPVGHRRILLDAFAALRTDAGGKAPSTDIGPPSSAPIANPEDRAKRRQVTVAAPQRYILPKNLRNAVKHLSDGELDLMHAATVEEMRRRGRTPSVETDLPVSPDMAKMLSPPTEKRRQVNIAEVPLTRGQVNAVRAAFKAGITPSRIARQFGISQSNVRKVLASDKSKR